MKTIIAGKMKILRISLAAAKANLVPGIVLVLTAAAVAAGYYLVPAVTAVLDIVAAFKTKYGILYSIPATAFFAGLVPFLFMRFTYSKERRPPWAQGLFFIVFWGYRGLEIDLFYTFQAWLFGSTATLAVVLSKVLVDQFVYNPIWAAPVQGLAFYWKDSGFRFSAFKRLNWKNFILGEIPVILISTWVVWIPATFVIYCLPVPLQIPLFNLVACFWTLLLTSITRK